MEVKFNKMQVPCLYPVVSQVQTREETMELRLSDGMPDMGKVLGCWGQVLLRGKEWHDTSASANGGVMVWVLYAPEDGTEPRVVEGWIPVQNRWEFPEESRDGMLTVYPWLSGLDGRNISARKLMLRAEVSMMGSGRKPWKAELSVPADLPTDIQILKKTYPVELPAEQGEKQFTLEETLPLPVGSGIHRIAGYRMMPKITEQKVMANRLLFKGKVMVHLLYLAEEGCLHTGDYELPFAQYTELDKDYAPNAGAFVMPVLTASELELSPDGLLAKAEICAQYTIFDTTAVEVVEDAYSPRRQVDLERDALYLPSRLDSRVLSVPVEGSAEGEFAKLMDVFSVSEPVNMDGDALSVQGQWQLMYRNGENLLRSDLFTFNGKTTLDMDEHAKAELWPMGMSMDAVLTGDGASVHGEHPVMVQIYNGAPIPMVTGMTIGELSEVDPERPSLILCRAGEDDLWNLAKKTGSTVEDILKANHLTEEPETGRMLLIPIL